MSIKDIVQKRGEVKGPGGKFKVRGLSLHDLLALSENHREALIHIFGKEEVRYDELLEMFPTFVTDLIAYAAGEEDSKEAVQQLQLGVQLAALEKIWELTALDMETLGKVVRAVTENLNRLNAEVEHQQSD